MHFNLNLAPAAAPIYIIFFTHISLAPGAIIIIISDKITPGAHIHFENRKRRWVTFEGEFNWHQQQQRQQRWR